LKKLSYNKFSKWQSNVIQAELSLIQLVAMFNHFESVFSTNVLNTLDATAWKHKGLFYETVIRKLLDGKYCLY